MQPPPPPGPRPHRRFDPLAGRWVLVSPHRIERPWQGEEAEPAAAGSDAYDPDCYLCPGNARAGGAVNPDYPGVFVFDNDFPALLPEPGGAPQDDALFRSHPAHGVARVVCFSPHHSRGLGALEPTAREAVIATFRDQIAALGRDWANVQVFENRGEMMGCSNPHPHAQIWATTHVPDIVADEDRRQRDWLAQRGTPMLLELAEREAGGVRAIASNAEWLAMVPFWAQWPFETLIVPRRRFARLSALDAAATASLAALLGRLLVGFDRLFDAPFPYSMGWHGAPFVDAPADHWQVHAHVYPPLLRSASVRKHMVGYELLAEPQRDLTPEAAAARLRAVM